MDLASIYARPLWKDNLDEISQKFFIVQVSREKWCLQFLYFGFSVYCLLFCLCTLLYLALLKVNGNGFRQTSGPRQVTVWPMYTKLCNNTMREQHLKDHVAGFWFGGENLTFFGNICKNCQNLSQIWTIFDLSQPRKVRSGQIFLSVQISMRPNFFPLAAKHENAFLYSFPRFHLQK